MSKGHELRWVPSGSGVPATRPRLVHLVVERKPEWHLQSLPPDLQTSFCWTARSELGTDEPTNHLDGAAVASLCAGLREHKGVVLVASHDKAFLEALQVTDQILVTRGSLGEPGRLTVKSEPYKREILGDKSKVEDFVSSAAHKIEEAEDMEELSPESGRAQKLKKKKALRQKIESVMDRIEQAEKKWEKASSKMSEEYNEELG
eukprot:g32842.t1